MKPAPLPLGIDIGSTRIRVLEAYATPQGARIRAVAAREVAPERAADADYISTLLEDALEEIGTRQRRCICALGEPEARLRTMTFPRMTAVERERNARFEAQRHVDYPIDEAVIRMHPLDAANRQWAVGIARSFALTTRLAALRKARLKAIAVDHDGCALTRALPGFDAIADIGHQRTSLHVMTPGAPLTLQTFNGGADVTRAIERELSLDYRTAEKRKRILGTAGAGERARAALSADVSGLIDTARNTAAIARVALVGNGARLPGLATDLEAATGAAVEMPVSDALRAGSYPEDVVRSSAPDWTLAAGLTMWQPR